MYILLQYCESNFKNQNYIKGQLSYFGNKPSFIVHSVLIPLSILPFLLKKRLLNSNNEEKAKSCQVGYMTSISQNVYPLLNKLFQLSLNLLERLVLNWEIKTLERDHVEGKTVSFFFSFPFSASLQTFCLTVRVNLNTQKYGFFCSSVTTLLFEIVWGTYLTHAWGGRGAWPSCATLHLKPQCMLFLFTVSNNVADRFRTEEFETGLNPRFVKIFRTIC